MIRLGILPALGTRAGESTIVGMKKKEEDVRRKMIVVRLNATEHSKLQNFKKKSTEKKVSTYLRKVALQEPVTILYRNGSADDFMREMLALKSELNAIGNNINQAVHKLHMLDRIPEFRSWIRQYETVHQQFKLTSDEIMTRCNQIHRLWSQE